MKRSLKDSDAQSEISARPKVFLDLFRTASSQTLARAAIAVGMAWIPLAILSVFREGAQFRF